MTTTKDYRQKVVEGGVRVTLNFKPEEYEMLGEMAKDADRSLSYMAVKAVRYFYEHGYQEENRLKP